MTQVASFGLDYSHEPPWSPWADTVVWRSYPFPALSQPLVSDIEFRPNGDLIIALADRLHWFTTLQGSGDVLLSRSSGPARWSVDTTSDHYRDEIPAYDNLPAISEGFLGALAAFPGNDGIVATGMRDASDGGLRWHDNQSGDVDGPTDGLEYVFGDLPPIGDVESLCPQVEPPTATPTNSPTATLTPQPSLTPTVTTTERATATPTVTRPPVPIYLPLVLNEQCEKRQAYADVALVLDVSTSMRRLTNAGQPKFDEVMNASMVFVDLLRLTTDQHGAHDQVGVVGFNDAAWVQQALTGDRFAVDASLRALHEHAALVFAGLRRRLIGPRLPQRLLLRNLRRHASLGVLVGLAQ